MIFKGALVAVIAFFGVAVGLEIPLEPVPGEELGDWAQVTLPLRLHPLTPPGARYDGPPLASELWGEFTLGDADYTLLLGIRHGGAADLWLSEDGQMEDGDELSGVQGPQHVRWDVQLTAEPPSGKAYTYELGILWPEGRGYVFLMGGAPRRGELVLDEEQYTVALVDGDISGVFGSERDFYAVDWTKDGVLHAEPGGHERFAVDEPFTVGERSFAVEDIAPDGSWIRLSPTEYRSPKTPLVPGYPAPEFSFRPFPDDSEISLRDFRGEVVLLDFWATWCLPCMEELPRLKELYDTYRDEGFQIVGVSLDTSAVALTQVLEDYAVEWPQYFDGRGWETAVAELYRVHATPHLILLDQQGVIHTVNPAPEELSGLIEELLGLPSSEGREQDRAEAGPVPTAAPAPEPQPETDDEEVSAGRPQWPLLLVLGLGATALLWLIVQGR